MQATSEARDLGLGLDQIPPEILDDVRWAISGLDHALQVRRRAVYYATCIAGKNAGEVDRAIFVERRRAAGQKAATIYQHRNFLDLFRELAAENGIDGEAVVRLLRNELKSARRANPSGRYFECKRVAREQREAYSAALSLLPKVGFLGRASRYGYDVRHKGICTDAEIPDPLSMSPAAYRLAAARILKAKHAAKVTAWQRQVQREAMIANLIARGKQTPQRVELAKAIRRDLAIGRHRGSKAAVRRAWLERKRQRRQSIEASSERLIARLKECLWFVDVETRNIAGVPTLVVLVGDLKVARKAIGGVASFEGKPIVVEKAKASKVVAV